VPDVEDAVPVVALDDAPPVPEESSPQAARRDPDAASRTAVK